MVCIGEGELVDEGDLVLRIPSELEVEEEVRCTGEGELVEGVH